MLEVLGRNYRLCDGVTRRSFLKIGALGMGGLSLPNLLAAQQAPARRDTAVILFWMAGGPSHIDTYDMKPAAPLEVRGPFRPIQTNLTGLQVCELMPRHARIADKLSVIRSLRHELGVHDDASHWVQTGYPLFNARNRGQLQPAQGAVVSHLRGPLHPDMPAYVCLPEAYSSPQGFYQAAATLGARHNPVNGGGDPTLGNYRTAEFALPREVTLDRLQDRRSLVHHMDHLRRRVETSDVAENMNVSQRRAFDLITGQKAREAFDLSREPIALRERYGKHAWGQATILARRLVEAGVTFVTINLYERDVDWWDDHYVIEQNLRRRLPIFDQALATLIEDLHERGSAERVLVAAFGEFGRTPHIDALAGRSHWPRAMSAVLSGGGIHSGQIIGATTSDGGEPRDRQLGPGDLLATMYRVLGIDHDTFLPDRQNRPQRLVEAGQPISELF
jgi:hypothetical protein